MRKAAGIILIILGVVTLGGMILDAVNMSFLDFPDFRLSVLMGTVPHGVVFGGFLVAGGVYCFKRRYWGLCLVSAVVPLGLWISLVVLGVVQGLMEGFAEAGLPELWRIWFLVFGTLVSTIFIGMRKKEWQEISDSVDCEVSKDD